MMTTECDIFQCKEMCERFFFLMLKHKYEGHDISCETCIRKYDMGILRRLIQISLMIV